MCNANTFEQGGKISQVYAYNAQNVKIGSAGKQTMAGNGDYLSFTVDQNVPGSQGQYIGIQNSKDATCVAWITVQSRDNTPKGVWTGDIGRMYVWSPFTHFRRIQADGAVLGADKPGLRTRNRQAISKTEPHTDLPAPGSMQTTITISPARP